MTTINSYIKAMEKINIDNIYIWFTDEGLPIVYGKSAIHLSSSFPEFSLIIALCSDQLEYYIIQNFPLETVLEKFINCQQLVDNHCIHIMNIKSI